MKTAQKKKNIIFCLTQKDLDMLETQNYNADIDFITCEKLLEYENSWLLAEECFNSFKKDLGSKIKDKERIILLISNVSGIIGGMLKYFIDYFSKKKDSFKIISSSFDDDIFEKYAKSKGVDYIRVVKTEKFIEQMKFYREKSSACILYTLPQNLQCVLEENLIKTTSNGLDKTTERLVNDYMLFNKDSKAIIEQNIKSPCFDLPKDIETIKFGSTDDGYHLFAKDGKLEYVHSFEPFANYTLINNPENFIKQVMNIIYLTGSCLSDKPEDERSYITIKTKDKTFYVKNTFFTSQLTCWYVYYNTMVYDKRLPQKDKEKRLKTLINKTTNGMELYVYLKKLFDNFDFIYAIMNFLQTYSKRKLYLYYIEKNEGFCSHEPMQRILTHVSEAHRLYYHKMPEKIVLLKQPNRNIWVKKEEFLTEGAIKEETNVPEHTVKIGMNEWAKILMDDGLTKKQVEGYIKWLKERKHNGKHNI